MTKNKGNYYKLRTKKWFLDKGYYCDYLEKYQRIFSKGRVIFIKKDLAGADGFAMNGDSIIFWQCKLNRSHIAEGIKGFKQFPYPNTVDKWIIVWKPRAKEPEIIEVD